MILRGYQQTTWGSLVDHQQTTSRPHVDHKQTTRRPLVDHQQTTTRPLLRPLKISAVLHASLMPFLSFNCECHTMDLILNATGCSILQSLYKLEVFLYRIFSFLQYVSQISFLHVLPNFFTLYYICDDTLLLCTFFQFYRRGGGLQNAEHMVIQTKPRPADV